MAKSHRLGLPLLAAGQAQKELSHNDALIMLDAIVHGCCPQDPSNDPPADPEHGCSYICGDDPTGDWAGFTKCIAFYSESGWRFIKPVDGLQLYDRGSGRTWRFAGGTWILGVIEAREIHVGGTKILGSQQPSIPNATGGSTVDIEARNTLAKMLSALRAHGIIAVEG